jgi:hypothetical protein
VELLREQLEAKKKNAKKSPQKGSKNSPPPSIISPPPKASVPLISTTKGKGGDNEGEDPDHEADDEDFLSPQKALKQVNGMVGVGSASTVPIPPVTTPISPVITMERRGSNALLIPMLSMAAPVSGVTPSGGAALTPSSSLALSALDNEDGESEEEEVEEEED